MSDPFIDQPPEDQPVPEPPADPEPVLGVAPLEAQPPGAEVKALDLTVANTRVPNGDEATHVIVHDDGTSWFHSLATIPRRFMDEVGNVIVGRHLNVTRDEASTPYKPPDPEPEPAPEEPA